MMDAPTVLIAIGRIEDQVSQLDKWAKESADKGDYSGARRNQEAAVDLHCAVEIIKGKHVCGMRDFSAYYGDVCDRCVLDAALINTGTEPATGKASSTERAEAAEAQVAELQKERARDKVTHDLDLQGKMLEAAVAQVSALKTQYHELLETVSVNNSGCDAAKESGDGP